MKISVMRHDGRWEYMDVDTVQVQLGLESEIIALSVLNEDEILVIRHGMAYPDGGEAVYTELLQ
jgi:hypothetical protein